METVTNGHIWQNAFINGQTADLIVMNGQIIWEQTILLGLLSSDALTNSEAYLEFKAQQVVKQNNKYIITSDGVKTIVAIAIPAGRLLSKIMSSNNELLFTKTASDNAFELSTVYTSFEINGVNQLYDVYVMKTDAPFSTGITFNIEIQ